MKLGLKIKERRKELKMSADELGKKLGKDRSTIYRYEKGAIENLPLDILEPVAKALNTTPAELMGWEEATPEEIKESDIMADITSRAFEDSDYEDFLMLSYKLDKAQILRAKELLLLVFKESLDVVE